MAAQLVILITKSEYCVVPEKIHTHPMGGHQEIPRGRGDLKSKNFRSKV